MYRKISSTKNGFSLVEMLVALVLISILMAGMLRVYGSALNSFAISNEAMGANRSKRWAVTQLEDDFQSAGFFYYHPDRVLPGYISVDTTSGQNALMIFPNQSATYLTHDPATNTDVSETVWFDEVQFLQDQPIQVRAQLSAQPASSGSLSLTVSSGNLSDVKPGDFVVLLDELYENCKVLSVDASTGTVTLDTTESATRDDADGSATGASKGLRSLQHFTGLGVIFVRPMQVVRYTVLPLFLDPSSTTSRIPCLVRDQAAYPSNGSRIVWPAYSATTAQLAAAKVVRTVIAENVAGQPVLAAPTLPNQYALRVDISPDNGSTWTRNGAASWTAVASNLNTWLATSGNGRPPYTSVTDSSNPIWFRNIPALFKLDVTARTAMMRADPNTVNQRVYTYRSQTIICQPRNFSFGL